MSRFPHGRIMIALLLTILPIFRVTSQPTGSDSWDVGKLPTGDGRDTNLWHHELPWHGSEVSTFHTHPQSSMSWIRGSNSESHTAEVFRPPTKMHTNALAASSSESHEAALTHAADDVQETHKKRLDWEHNLRKALGRQGLQFTYVKNHYWRKFPVAVAEDTNEVQGHPSVVSPPWLPNPHSDEKKQNHFLRDPPQSARTAVVKDLPKGKSDQQYYVHFASKSNLDFLNREYFLNHLRFFPVNTKELTKSELNKLFSERRILHVFPPRTEHGLALLVARHDPTKATELPYLEALTGQESTDQVVSLWSPILKSDGRTTMVLYGIGQLDPNHRESVIKHLFSLGDSVRRESYSAVYALDGELR